MGKDPHEDNGLVEMEISKIRIDERRGEQVVVLKERNGHRFLPIIIGISEVTAIKMKITGIQPPRPLTHDLFNDTIANNINLGRLGASQESIETAACQAYAHDFIMDLPEKYETRVGDRGWNLSGGQRQRVALARAILKGPEILIMDEATSSLDSESEQLIQRYLREIRGTRTIVVVAHRMSTIQDADKIVVLQDGKIVEEGQWDSLVKKEGVLANFQRLQSGS